MINLYPNKNSTIPKLKVTDATKVLAHWGIAKNDKKTRDLITRGKLQAKKAGVNPDDRRSGYLISEKALYDIITSEIPAAELSMEITRKHLKARGKEGDDK